MACEMPKECFKMSVRQVSIGGNTIGIIGLDEVFAEVKASGESDEAKLKEMIFEKTKAKNYVAPGLEDAYREDLYDEYKVFVGLKKSRANKPGKLQVRVYGPGCPRCERLDRSVMEVIAGRGLDVDYQYVKDIEEMKRSGVMGSPALVINGKIVLLGNIPGHKRLEDIILKAMERA